MMRNELNKIKKNKYVLDNHCIMYELYDDEFKKHVKIIDNICNLFECLNLSQNRIVSNYIGSNMPILLDMDVALIVRRSSGNHRCNVTNKFEY